VNYGYHREDGVWASGVAYPGGKVFYTINLPPAPVPMPTIEALTNTRRADGQITDCWTARRTATGYTLTNNLTGAMHDLPWAALELAGMLCGMKEPNGHIA
jgi:hypothetical protein